MKYTIEQINEAWIKFNQPMFLIKKGMDVDGEMLSKGVISSEDMERLEIIPKGDFISYLIGYFSLKKGAKGR